MNTKVLAILLVFSFATAFSAQQEPQDTIALTDFPAPPWPQNGVIPAELKDKYVFLDFAKNEYVVAYPANLGAETFEKDGPAPLKIARYELLRNVQPAISVTTTAVNPDTYKYAYSVANGPQAKQSIDQSALVLPVLARKAVIRQPVDWLAVVQNGRTFKLKRPEWIRSGVAAVWSFGKAEAVIQPGTVKTGFELESELRPGFTVAYLRKAESVESRVATHGNVPKAVKDQIDAILAVEYNSQTLLTIGPKFDKFADDYAVASDFAEGIGVLSRSGILDPNSEFVKNTLAELKRMKQGDSASIIKLTSPAGTPAETQVLSALKLSLHSN